jgi:hypothetical protein
MPLFLRRYCRKQYSYLTFLICRHVVHSIFFSSNAIRLRTVANPPIHQCHWRELEVWESLDLLVSPNHHLLKDWRHKLTELALFLYMYICTSMCMISWLFIVFLYTYFRVFCLFLCTLAVPQMPAHSTVPFQVATHLELTELAACWEGAGIKPDSCITVRGACYH